MEKKSFYTTRQKIASALYAVDDPEIPGISIIDLGMVIDIRQEADAWHIDLAPTYSGCPAIDVIPFLAKAQLENAGFPHPVISMIVTPPWSTEWISETGHQKLKEYGIAPPSPRDGTEEGVGRPDACPQCNSSSVALVSAYGATPCKAIYRCTECLETFDYFKCY